MGRCGSLWVVVDRCGSFRVLVTTLKISIFHQANFGKQDPTGTRSKRLTLKRSHDQMTTMNKESRIETAGHSVGKVTGD